MRIRGVFFLYLGLLTINGELLINISKGTEKASVFHQYISGNSTADTVTIKFLTPDGVGVQQVVDLKNKVSISVYTVPGEQDLGEDGYQVFCFVSLFTGDMIPAEAVNKLRQKNSGTVRVAEEHRGTTVQDNPVKLIVPRSSHISALIPSLCREARDATYSSEHEIKKILGNGAHGGSPSEFIKKNLHAYETADRCNRVDRNEEKPCICSISSCVWWYPCSLKFCRNMDGEEHRCGIRTCSKCTSNRFLVSSPLFCTWDR